MTGNNVVIRHFFKSFSLLINSLRNAARIIYAENSFFLASKIWSQTNTSSLR